MTKNTYCTWRMQKILIRGKLCLIKSGAIAFNVTRLYPKMIRAIFSRQGFIEFILHWHFANHVSRYLIQR
jgi:hypothetical protein